jgi:glycosyltransferase involved in cell wall biosynthesis
MTAPDQKELSGDVQGHSVDQRMHGPATGCTPTLVRQILEGLSYRSVLNVDCGDGLTIAELFADRNDLKIVGTDASSSALDTAKRRNPRAEFRCFDFGAGPVKEHFDLVICNEAIKDFENSQSAVKRLAEMTDRYLVITTPCECARNHDEIEQMVKTTGLRLARTMECGKGGQLVILAERERKPLILQPLPKDPCVSIVIPVRNEEHYMEQCIASLKKLDYPADKLEIIFADGRSTDRTAEIARANGCRVVDNPGLKISAGRNQGFAASKGQIIVFTDADCVFDTVWLKTAVLHFKDDRIAGLSGPTRVPREQNDFGKAVGAVFGLAGMIGATVHHETVDAVYETDDLPGCNAFYRREALAAVMPTNTLLRSNEDVEMNAYIRREGFRLFMTPDVQVQHFKRTSSRGFWKQMQIFAAGRAQLARRDRTFLKFSHEFAAFGVPTVGVLILAGLIFSPGFREIFLVLALIALVVLFMIFTASYSLAVAVRAIPAVFIAASGWIIGFLREWYSPTPFQQPGPNTHENSVATNAKSGDKENR